MMMTYRFTIEVSGLDPDQELLESRFYGNGVEDALVYVSGGHLFLAFDREAPDEKTAVLSAREDIVRRGGGVARVIRDEPAAEARTA
jgi:hypothetical protein